MEMCFSSDYNLQFLFQGWTAVPIPCQERREARLEWAEGLEVCLPFWSFHLCKQTCVFIYHHVCFPLLHTNVITNIASLNSTHLLCHNFWGSGVWVGLC